MDPDCVGGCVDRRQVREVQGLLLSWLETMMATWIRWNVTIPIKQTQAFPTYSDNQPGFQVYEHERAVTRTTTCWAALTQ